MGRIFEKRKTTMFARWNRMAKQILDANFKVAEAAPPPKKK